MSDAELRVERIRLQAVELEVRYQGRGPTMLVLHGGGGPITGLPFAQALAQSHSLVEPVHPGFAGSAIPGHFDGMEDLVYCYLDLMDALDLQDVIVLGTSMGGWLAAEIAVRHARRIRQLVLVNAVGVKVGCGEDREPDSRHRHCDFSGAPTRARSLVGRGVCCVCVSLVVSGFRSHVYR